MFSIVIPLYNKENEIKKTLDSVLRQTYTDFEVIIVNDGSTDSSEKIVSGINDARITIVNKENGGVSSARNKGILEANNEWIAFLDADDLWKLDKLEKVAKIIKSNLNISWLLSGYTTIKDGKKFDYIYNKSGLLVDALDDLNKGLSIQTSTVIVKKDIFLKDEKLFFKEGINNSEDREVWYRLIFRFPSPCYIKESLSYYIKDTLSESLSHVGNKEKHFLELSNRLSDDIINLTEKRKKKILKFLESFNKRALWNYWLNGNLTEEHSKYLDSKSLIIQKKMNNLPHFFKKQIVKFINFIG